MLTRYRSRRGLTLLELLAVLLILVALAAAIIPLIFGVVERAHGASSADHLGEIAKWMQVYKLDFRSFPDGFDSLVDSSSAPYAGLPGFGTGTVPYATVTDITDEQHNALVAAGIDLLFTAPASVGADGATFYDRTSSTTLSEIATPTGAASGTDLLTLTAASITKLGLDAGETYVLLGVGPEVAMFGKTAMEPPVHFGDDPETPAEVYAFYAAIFRVSGVEKAQLVKVVAIHEESLDGLGDHIGEYYEGVPE